MEYIIHIVIFLSIYAILAISLNLIVGYTGLISVTQAAFYGIGAYAVAISTTLWGINFFPAVLVGLIVSAIFGIMIGGILSNFNGDYFVLGSLGFNIILSGILVNLQNVTGGPLGISGIDRPSIFGFILTDNLFFAIFALFVTVVIYFIANFITSASFGRVIQAIREDEQAAQIFGYNTRTYKLIIFIISAMMASVAGALFAAYMSFISPSTFNASESIFILSIIILGGLANHKGVVYGTIFLVLLPEVLRFIGLPTAIAADLRQLIYGLILILLMIYRPKGLMGKYTM